LKKILQHKNYKCGFKHKLTNIITLDSVTSLNIYLIAAVTPSGPTVLVLDNRDISASYAISIINQEGSILNLNLEPRSWTTIVYNE
jgi:hypothetical protein